MKRISLLLLFGTLWLAKEMNLHAAPPHDQPIRLVAPSPPTTNKAPLFSTFAPSSVIHLPLSLSLASAQQALERAIPPTIRQHGLPISSNATLEFTFHRQGSIQLSSATPNGLRLTSRFCGLVRVDWSHKIPFARIREYKNVHTCFTLTIRTHPILHSDWRMTSHTTLEALDIHEAHTRFGPFPISLRSFLYKHAFPALQKLTPQLDQEITKAYTQQQIPRRMAELWNKSQQPHRISLPHPSPSSLWLIVRPIQFIASQPQITPTEIKLYFGLHTRLAVVLHKALPASPPLVAFPNLVLRPLQPPSFHIHLPLFIPWHQAQPLLRAHLVNKPLALPNASLVVQDLRLSSGGNKLFLTLDVDARTTYPGVSHLTASFSLEAAPSLDSQGQHIRLQNLRYEASTRNYLQRFALYLISPSIKKMLAQQARLSLAKPLADLQTKANQAIAQLRINNITHQGQITSLKPIFLGILPDGLLAIVSASGHLSIQLQP